MFKNPEEAILAILGIIWIVVTYFINGYLGVNSGIKVEIWLYNAVWAITTFMVWRQEKIYLVWPLSLGILVAAWTPLLTWYAQKNSIGYNSYAADMICTQVPWYASWYTKLGIVLLAISIGYITLFIQNRKK